MQTKKLSVVFLLFCLLQGILTAQTAYWRVYFKDKGPILFNVGSSLYNETINLHSQKALDRRKKNIISKPLVTIEDAPIYSAYIDSVSKYCSRIRLQLRWRNYIVIETDSLLIQKISSLPFVKATQRTAGKLLIQNSKALYNTAFVRQDRQVLSIMDNCGVFRYGPSLNQASIMNIPFIHSMGITGKGALVSFLDSGFRWRNHNGTKNAQVLDEFDFIQLDSMTANDTVDNPGQDYHGTICFSTVSAFHQDSIIGLAHNADFLLAKTEDIPTEQHLEEDNYAAAVEWSEAHGCDIITSSLGYSVFNQPGEENYLFSDFNGNTTITAKVVNDAVKRGVICITAAGNDGPRDSTLITPSDADSVIAVGAISPDAVTPAGFTSRGPRSDGAIKPDISAQGVGVICTAVGDSVALSSANGTSLATPLIAGATALIVSAFPELKGYEIKKCLFETAASSSKKDNVLGYGLANVLAAMKKAGIIISPPITYPISQYQRLAFFVQSQYPIMNVDINIRKKGDDTFTRKKAYRYDTNAIWAIDIPFDSLQGDTIEFYAEAVDSKSIRRYPPITPGVDSIFSIHRALYSVPCGIDTTVLPIHTYPMNIVNEIYSKDKTFTLESQMDLNFTLYGIRGDIELSGILSLMPGTYDSFDLSRLLPANHWRGIMLKSHNGLLYNGLLQPILE